MSVMITIVGKRIRDLRKLKGYTQEELAERSGLQYTYIGGVERGERNISIETLEKIVIGLGVKPQDLFIESETDLSDDEKEKMQLIDGYKILLRDFEVEEIKVVHKVIRDILQLFKSKINE